MGRPILWREIECRAMGHDRCRVVGKPVEEWGEDARDDLRFLQIGDFVKWTPTPLGRRARDDEAFAYAKSRRRKTISAWSGSPAASTPSAIW